MAINREGVEKLRQSYYVAFALAEMQKQYVDGGIRETAEKIMAVCDDWLEQDTRIDKLLEALGFYANKDNWVIKDRGELDERGQPRTISDIGLDGGMVARLAVDMMSDQTQEEREALL